MRQSTGRPTTKRAQRVRSARDTLASLPDRDSLVRLASTEDWGELYRAAKTLGRLSKAAERLIPVDTLAALKGRGDGA